MYWASRMPPEEEVVGRCTTASDMMNDEGRGKKMEGTKERGSSRYPSPLLASFSPGAVPPEQILMKFVLFQSPFRTTVRVWPRRLRINICEKVSQVAWEMCHAPMYQSSLAFYSQNSVLWTTCFQLLRDRGCNVPKMHIHILIRGIQRLSGAFLGDAFPAPS